MPAYRARVVVESDQTIARAFFPRLLDDVDETFRHFRAVDHMNAVEEEMPAVIRITIADLEQFDIGRIAIQTPEQLRIVRFVPVVHTEPELQIHLVHCRLAVLEY